MKIIVALFFSVLFIGCASTDQYKYASEPDPSTLTTLIFYRTNSAFHSLNPEKPFIYLDDKVIAKLGTGEQKTASVPAGQYRLSVRQSWMFMPGRESDSFVHTFEAGKEYYIVYSMELGDLIPTGNTISVVGTSAFYLSTKEEYERLR